MGFRGSSKTQKQKQREIAEKRQVKELNRPNMPNLCPTTPPSSPLTCQDLRDTQRMGYFVGECGADPGAQDSTGTHRIPLRHGRRERGREPQHAATPIFIPMPW